MTVPSAFKDRTRSLLGEEQYLALEAALRTEAPVSIRVNRVKCDAPVEGEPIPWSSKGVYLERRPTFTFDPLFHAGCYYVQEASSMFVEQVLRAYVSEPVVMLDLCAAPGGKSTHVRSLLPEGSLLVANEVMRGRSQVLAENLIKWGHPEVIVTNNDPADFTDLTALFDVILTDVPCSGEGMFRKDPVAVDEWSEDNVQICWQRQRRILTDVWPSLKPGGILIYSTCTYNKEEDEENVAWIARELGAEVLELPTRSEWNITGNLIGQDFPVYRFMPHRTKGEGFFLAALRKTNASTLCHSERSEESVNDKYDAHRFFADAQNDKRGGGAGKNEKSKKKQKDAKTNAKAPVIPRELKQALLRPEAFHFEAKGADFIAFPQVHRETYTLLQQYLRIIHAGITLGTTKGKDIIPDHSLAMSTALAKETFPCAELTYGQAIAYLRKEAVVLDPSVPRGYVLLTYRQVPLGFAKNIGNRANNLYPQEWRIRSTHVPDEEVLFLMWNKVLMRQM